MHATSNTIFGHSVSHDTVNKGLRFDAAQATTSVNLDASRFDSTARKQKEVERSIIQKMFQ